MGTTAKASLISHKSTSATDQPAFFNACCEAPTGAVANHSGSCACVAWLTMRANGLQPNFFAVLSRINTIAAAPSLIDELDAAVMVPSFLNAGFNAGILSSLILPGPSSLAITVSPARPFTVTGAISFSNAPEAMAACARCTLVVANASCSAREKLYFAAQSSPKVPMLRPGS